MFNYSWNTIKYKKRKLEVKIAHAKLLKILNMSRLKTIKVEIRIKKTLIKTTLFTKIKTYSKLTILSVTLYSRLSGSHTCAAFVLSAFRLSFYPPPPLPEEQVSGGGRSGINCCCSISGRRARVYVLKESDNKYFLFFQVVVLQHVSGWFEIAPEAHFWSMRLAVVNSVFNPLIGAAMCKPYRRGYLYILCKFLHCCGFCSSYKADGKLICYKHTDRKT